MNELYVRIEKNRLLYGGVCSKKELPNQFKRLKEIMKQEAL